MVVFAVAGQGVVSLAPVRRPQQFDKRVTVTVARHSAVVTAIALTAALIGTAFVTFLAAVAVLGIDVSEPTPPSTYLLFLSVLYAVDVVIAAAYLQASGRGFAFLNFRRPTLRDLGYIIAAILLLFAVGVLLSLLIFVFVLPEPPSTVFTDIELTNPINYLVFIPFALLVNGPVEEVLFRGIIQQSLSERYSHVSAILLASVLFALFHLPAFYAVLLTSNPPLVGIAVGLVVFTAAGIVFGSVYARTNNLTVPAVAHGVYNALISLMFYFTTWRLLCDILQSAKPSSRRDE